MDRFIVRTISNPGVPQVEPIDRVLAIGKFDGLHKAHQAVIAQALVRQNEGLGQVALFTFSPHPRYVLQGDPAYRRWLTPPTERGRIAMEYGVYESFVTTFDAAFQAQTAEEFVEHYLLPLGVKHIVVGYDFRFGRSGAYSTHDLARIASAHAVGCDVVEPVALDGMPVSSSRIRGHLAEGHPERAAALLGRPFEVRGTVIAGDQRGRTIGYPTANLRLTEPFVIPKEGVYAVRCWLDGKTSTAGMMNIGRRPTVEQNGELSLEVHLFDFSADLYGRELVVGVIGRTRDERRFSSLEELQTQLGQDAAQSRILVARFT